jgi:hypothetical protein
MPSYPLIARLYGKATDLFLASCCVIMVNNTFLIKT